MAFRNLTQAEADALIACCICIKAFLWVVVPLSIFL